MGQIAGIQRMPDLEPTQQTVRVLFVEDNKADVRLAIRLLEKDGLQVVAHVTDNLAQCAEILGSNTIDVVVSDYSLPNCDGWEVLKTVRTNQPRLPFILLTASIGDEQAAKFIKHGADDYLLKDNSSRLPLSIRAAIKRHRSDAALQQTEVTLSKIFEHSPDAMSITRFADAEILRVNRAYLELTGYQRHELMGKNLVDLGIWLNVDERPNLMRRLQKEGRIKNYETQYRTNYEETRDVQISLELLEIDGELCILSILRDQTEYKKLELRNLQSQKLEAVGSLAAGVAHDFNNVLGVILGHAELMEMQMTADATIQKRLKAIKTAGERAAQLTRQLLNFSRQQVAEPKLTNVNDVIRETEAFVAKTIEENIEIVAKLDNSVGIVKIDPGQLQQVLLNLFVNARDAMPNGGNILIETSNLELSAMTMTHGDLMTPGEYVLLTVSDTGTGMDEATKQRIFEPFFTTKERGRGTGLGLASAYGIVKQSGGFIWVYSEVGRGTTFKIYLPRVRAAATALAVVKRPQLVHGGGTILVAEDGEDLRELIADVLQQCGFTVISAGNAANAIEVSTRHDAPIDLLITDMIMPGQKSGADLAEYLTARNHATKVLFMSGYTQNSPALQQQLQTGCAYLAKPFTPGQLTAKVREVLDASS